MSVAVTPDGKHAVVGGFMGSLAVLDLAELTRTEVDPDALVLRAELLAGQRLHEGGGTVNLSADEWLDRWRAFRRQSPAEAPIDLGSASSLDAAGRDAGARSPEAVRPDDLPSRFGEAAEWLGAGRVAEAIAAGRELIPVLQRLVDESPDDPSLRHRLALALVLAGDREGYRRACAATLERLGRSQDCADRRGGPRLPRRSRRRGRPLRPAAIGRDRPDP